MLIALLGSALKVLDCRGWAVLAALMLGLPFGSAAQAAPAKLALVVGNAAYQHVPGLQTSARDAQDMAAALRALGFEVTLLTDVGSEVFWVVLDTFAKQAQDAETVVFYYSGHAFQRNGVNQLVPVGAKLDSATPMEQQTWALDDIAKRLKGASSQLLIFLDACRTNPLPDALRAGMADGEGLAQFDGGAGTFVAFATRPGAVAFDQNASSANSPFTGALLASIRKPGQSISDLMITVRNEVEQATGGEQTPWDQSSLRVQFHFVPEIAIGLDELAGLEVDTETTEVTVAGEVVVAMAEPAPALTRQIVSRVMGDYVLPLPPVTSETRRLSGPTVLTPVSGGPVTRLKGADAGQAVLAAPEDLPRAIQTELKRIGCYAQGIDGDWGRGSVAALERYFAVKKLAPPEAEGGAFQPTETVWRALAKEPEKTCPPIPVVAKAKPKVKKPASTSKPAAAKPAASKPAATKPAAAKPAAVAPAKKGTTCKFMVVAIICN